LRFSLREAGSNDHRAASSADSSTEPFLLKLDTHLAFSGASFLELEVDCSRFITV
jgi:hypothetical protein